MKNWYYIFCIFPILLNSCYSETSNIRTAKQDFGFDKIEHYTIKLTEKEKQDILPIPPKLNSTKKNTYFDSLRKEIIAGRLDLLNNKNEILELEKIGYKKQPIVTDKYSSISSILTNKDLKARAEFKCFHYYQDILIFKLKDTVNSVVQICFSCKSIIINTNELEFSSDINEEDFNNLHSILNRTE